MTTPKETVRQQLLLVRCQRGDRKAMEELVAVWEKRLFYYVRRIVDQEADAWDVMQKTWVKVFRRVKSLKDPQSFPCWLYTLTRNTALNHIRQRPGARLASDTLDQYEDLPAEDDSATVFEDVQAVHDALGRISSDHCEVLTLFFLEDLSVEEIGRVIGVPQGTVKSRIHYAKRALRQLMEKEGER
jgi:RNA polymerase sigma-70 factor (ECF subfamily)